MRSATEFCRKQTFKDQSMDHRSDTNSCGCSFICKEVSKTHSEITVETPALHNSVIQSFSWRRTHSVGSARVSVTDADTATRRVLAIVGRIAFVD